MDITKDEIAGRLRKIAQLKQLAGESHFRAAAYDRAAQTIETLDENIMDLYNENRISEIKGIGSSIAENINGFIEEGSMPDLEKYRSKVPESLVKWLDISGLGPKNIYKIHNKLEISTIDELKEACKDGRVAELEGLGEKSAAKIIKSIEWMQQFGDRWRLDEASETARLLYDFLKAREEVKQIDIAGSLRRARETIGDIDILIGAPGQKAETIFDAFVQHEQVVDILGRGETKCSVRTGEGRQVDLRVVEPDKFPAALMYFTGSKEHNVVMRQRARKRNMSLNEYGLFRLNDEGETDFERPVDYTSESDIYEKLDLGYIPPELREDRGEFDHFSTGRELDLVEEDDIRGVIHAHSTWSDGRYTIRQMAEACITRGYSYLGISDHSQTAAYAGGLTPDEVRQQWKEIDRLNEELSGEGHSFRILKGIESDILADGSLDYDDSLLEGFDFVIASVHSGLDMSKTKMMERFRRAIQNPHTQIIGHPTGRLLLKRDGSELDMDELIDLAVEYDTAIEINANPWRLDLDWRHGNKAREAGLITAVNPDAHSTEGIDHIRYGIKIARKGKFGKDRILNTWTADEVMNWFNPKI